MQSDLEREADASLDPRDGELWTGLMDGVEADFAALFRRHNKVVYNFAFRATASWSRAEDITQATFMTIWRRAREGTVDPLRRDSAVPILISIARNEVLNNARSQKRRLRLVDRIQEQPHAHDNNVASWLAQEAGMERVRMVLDKLPAAQRAVIELVVWTGLDLAECADVLNIPVGTVKSRLSRARRKLATTEVAELLGGASA